MIDLATLYVIAGTVLVTAIVIFKRRFEYARYRQYSSESWIAILFGIAIWPALLVMLIAFFVISKVLDYYEGEYHE